jgi:hypothetical protein
VDSCIAVGTEANRNNTQQKNEGNMKYKTIPSAFLLSTFLFFLVIPATAAVEVGDKAPDFELPSTQGGQAQVEQLSRGESRPHRVLRPRLYAHLSQGTFVQSGRL